MALTKCPECSGRVSNYAANCPHCGYVISQYLNEPYNEPSVAPNYSTKTPQTTQYIYTNDQANERKVASQRIGTPKSRKNSESRDAGIGCLVILIFIVIPLVFAFWPHFNSNSSNSYDSGSYSSSSNDSSDKKTIAQLHAEAFVKKYLKSPSTAKFPSYNEYSYDYNGNKWTVSGYVDAQNSYGATLRQDFTVSFTVSSSDWYNATLDSIDID